VKRALAAVIVVGAVTGMLGVADAGAKVPRAADPPGATRRASSSPVLAYYYIWFEPASWSRAKTDHPKLGPYSSDDASVMTRHVRLAKRAGIEGFLVSWKHTPTLDRRLRLLAGIAEREEFGLGIVYQGLDFRREPLPADRVAADLDFFAVTFAARRPFGLFPRPLVVWSGTWRFSTEDVARVTTGRRSALAILASERNVAGYERIASSVDGNAYYWSSVNPSTFPRYVEKLVDLGRAVHTSGGLWIAPAAPGFDARAIGGTSRVDRHGDETLLHEIDAALASSPDALGIISWNEFSENSHIEPSVRYGSTALNAVGVRLGEGPVAAAGDSGTGRALGAAATGGARPAGVVGRVSRAAAQSPGPPPGVWVTIVFTGLFAVFVMMIASRARRRPRLRSVTGVEPTERIVRPGRRRRTPWYRQILRRPPARQSRAGRQ
jgi:hypothetical protein